MTEVRAKKALGQHFLVDLNIARKICESLSGGPVPADAATAAAASDRGAAGAAGDVLEVARLACAPADTLGNMPFEVTPEKVAAAMLAADAYGRAALAE